jgi:flagellar basal-body rod protein FlgB
MMFAVRLRVDLSPGGDDPAPPDSPNFPLKIPARLPITLMGRRMTERLAGSRIEPNNGEWTRGRIKPTVEILDSLFGPYVNNLQRAMTRTTQRHGLLIDNLANLNTPGYKRKDMDFGIALDEQLAGSSPFGNKRGKSDGVQEDTGSIRLDGNSVDLEREVMAIAETELHYQALTDMTSSYFSTLKNIIREGK